MGSVEKQLKDRAKEPKYYFKKGAKIVGECCKKSWQNVKRIRSA